MACKERKDNVEKMLADLGHPAEVIRDEKHSAIDTICRALDTDEPLIMMEDDIELCDNFYERAMDIIKDHEDEYVMFYAFGSFEHEHSWYNCNQTTTTQAYYVPGWWWKKMVEFLKQHPQANRPNDWRYEIWLGRFLAKNWIKKFIVSPCLVQHLCLDSMISPKHSKHFSRTFIWKKDK